MGSKFRNIVMISILAIAGIFGVSSAVINKQAEKTPVVEKARAEDNISFRVSVPLDTPSDYYIIVSTKCQTGNDQSWIHPVYSLQSDKYKGHNVYYGSYQDWYYGSADMYIKLFDSSGNEKANKRPVTSWVGGGTYNGKIYNWDKETWESYEADKNCQIKCGSGDYVDMTWDEGGGLASDVKQQFSATFNITAGESLRFKVDGSETTPSYSGGYNNYHDDAVCVSVTSATIYLKYKNDGSYDAWVPGYTSCTVVVGGKEYTTTQSGDDFDTVLVYVNKSETVSVSWEHIVINTYLNPTSPGGCFTSDGAGTVTCVLTGAYTIRVHYNDMHTAQNTVYIWRTDSSTATYLATLFNDEIGGTCDTLGNTNPDKLKDSWDNVAVHFSGQPSSITSLFVKNSSDSEILEMMGTTGVDGKYQYVIHKYGTSVASDFLGTGVTKAAIRDFSPISILGGSEDSLSTLIIIIASSVALLSVTALSILVIKKRKNKEQD